MLYLKGQNLFSIYITILQNKSQMHLSKKKNQDLSVKTNSLGFITHGTEANSLNGLLHFFFVRFHNLQPYAH